MSDSSPPALADAVRAIVELLLQSEFSEYGPLDRSSKPRLRIFEDSWSILALGAYETWQELKDDWRDAQGVLVDRMSGVIARSDPKAWDGYLVLLTTDDSSPAKDAALIRSDTSRLRKLVATGRELRDENSITDLLLPVLPFQLENSEIALMDLGARVHDIVDGTSVDSGLAEAAIVSFEESNSPMSGVWHWRQKQ